MGQAIDVGLQVREMMYHKVKLNKILSRATGQTEEKVRDALLTQFSSFTATMSLGHNSWYSGQVP